MAIDYLPGRMPRRGPKGKKILWAPPPSGTPCAGRIPHACATAGWPCGILGLHEVHKEVAMVASRRPVRWLGITDASRTVVAE